MKKISKWAKIHPYKARIIIVILHFISILNAICLGFLLNTLNIGQNILLLILFAGIFLLSFIFYPKKSNKKILIRNFYLRQKTHDFILVVSYSIVIAIGVNNFLSQNIYEPSFLSNSARYEENISFQENSKNELNSNISLKFNCFNLNEITDNKTVDFFIIKKNNWPNIGIILLKSFLILLSLGISLFLGSLVAFFACNISCAGYNGFAIIVLILGWGGLLALLILATIIILKKIGSKRKTKLEINQTIE